MGFRIRAKYPGHCSSCDQPIEPGETIHRCLYGGWQHVDCIGGTTRPLKQPSARVSEHRLRAEQQRHRDTIKYRST